MASDLAVGDDRLQLLLVGADGATLKPDASDVSVAIRPDQGGASIPLGTPVYYPWPGSRGAFVVRARFDSAGIWWADVDLPGMGTASAAFIVRDHSLSPAVGEAPPDADTRVATTAEGLKKITSDPNPDPAFYAISLEDAMQDGEPVVVAFGTPAYCETATCGPQLDELRTLRSEFGARVLFIHVEIYDNPEQIQGDLSRAILSPVVDAWQLPSDPWTFVIDRSGHIAGRYEGFTTAAELRPELERVLATP